MIKVHKDYELSFALVLPCYCYSEDSEVVYVHEENASFTIEMHTS